MARSSKPLQHAQLPSPPRPFSINETTLIWEHQGRIDAMEKDMSYFREAIDRLENNHETHMKELSLQLRSIETSMKAIEIEITTLKITDAKNQLPINIVIDIVKYILIAATGAVAALLGGNWL